MHIINMSSHALGKKGKCMQYKHLHYVYIFLCKVDYNNDKFSKVPPYTYNAPSVCANFLEVVVFLIKKKLQLNFQFGPKKKEKENSTYNEVCNYLSRPVTLSVSSDASVLFTMLFWNVSTWLYMFKKWECCISTCLDYDTWNQDFICFPSSTWY